MEKTKRRIVSPLPPPAPEPLTPPLSPSDGERERNLGFWVQKVQRAKISFSEISLPSEREEGAGELRLVSLLMMPEEAMAVFQQVPNDHNVNGQDDDNKDGMGLAIA